MSLTDSTALTAAWLIAPALIALIAAGLGLLIGHISGLRLRFLTLPTGLLVAVTSTNGLLWLHLPPRLVVVVVVVATLTGFWLDNRGRDRGKSTRWWWLGNADLRWAAAAGVVAWLIGMLPLVLGGRLGVLGYVLNNDATIHLTIIEVLRDHGVAGLSDRAVSQEVALGLYSSGYPTGSHSLVMLEAMLTKSSSFHLWTPILATLLGVTAVAGYHFHHEFRSPRAIAVVGSVFVGTGYLTYSYMLQGGLKEVLFALIVLTTVALATIAYDAGLRPRTLVPVAFGTAAMLSVMGLGAAAWLAPVGLAFAAVCVVRPPAGVSRRRAVGSALLLGAGTMVLISPLIAQTISFVADQSGLLNSQDQTGNMLGPVPWRESLGIWFNHDYRESMPEMLHGVNRGLIDLALVAVLIGTSAAILRRQWAMPFALLTTVFAAVVMVARLSIYFEAKAYVVLAPVMAIAIGFGITTLLRMGRAFRVPAYVVGIVLTAAAAASLALTFVGVWNTPSARFGELIEVAEQLGKNEKVLISDREDYARVLFERSHPFQPWQTYPTAVQGLRNPELIGDPARASDIDDFTDSVLSKAKWLVIRLHPGASRPPGNFAVSSTRRFYSVWRRDGPDPIEHLPIGAANQFWASSLDCRSPEVKALVARAAGKTIRISIAGDAPIELATEDRSALGAFSSGPLPGLLSRDSSNAVLLARPQLERRVTYDVFLRGSFNRGFQHIANDRHTGFIHDDLGLQSGWQLLGSFVAKGHGQDASTMLGLEKGFWRPGSRRPDLVGSTVYAPRDSKRKVVTVDANKIDRYCGKRVDWIERP